MTISKCLINENLKVHWVEYTNRGLKLKKVLILGFMEFFSIFKIEYLSRNSLNICKATYNLKYHLKASCENLRGSKNDKT